MSGVKCVSEKTVHHQYGWLHPGKLVSFRCQIIWTTDMTSISMSFHEGRMYGWNGVGMCYIYKCACEAQLYTFMANSPSTHRYQLKWCSKNGEKSIVWSLFHVFSVGVKCKCVCVLNLMHEWMAVNERGR